MKVTFYIDSDEYDDGDFDMRNDYYSSNEEFFSKIEEDMRMNEGVAYEVTRNLGKNILNKKTVFPTSNNVSTKQPKKKLYHGEGELIDENGDPESIDGFFTNCFSNDYVLYNCRFDALSFDGPFEESFRLWITEHNNINRYKNKLDDEKIWDYEPKKTFFVKFLNKANVETCATLKDCKIIADNGNGEYTLYIDRMNLIENI